MMKILVVLAFVLLATSALPIEEERVNGENGWYVPNDDGSFYWLSKEDAEPLLNTETEIKGRVSLNEVKFYLLTQENPTEQQEITANQKSISSSFFNPANPTRITIHGWKGSRKDDLHFNIADGWLSRGDYNMIAVDWARARSLEYVSSVKYVPAVGKKVATMIDYLNANFNMSLDNLQIIGHSLGAHVSGFAAKNVKNGKVHTVVGLDPAMPLYSYDKSAKRLNSTDAVYVESIQTNGGKLGFLKPIGKGSFYPNGGKTQPGCGIDLTGSCSHARSYIYYATSLKLNNFPSVKCADYNDAVKKDCGSTYSSALMGAETNAYMQGGHFYVPVSSKYPYGLGTD